MITLCVLITFGLDYEYVVKGYFPPKIDIQTRISVVQQLSFLFVIYLDLLVMLFKKKSHLYLELDLPEAYVAPKRHHAKKNL
jgi:hypothetical protein